MQGGNSKKLFRLASLRYIHPKLVRYSLFLRGKRHKRVGIDDIPVFFDRKVNVRSQGIFRRRRRTHRTDHVPFLHFLPTATVGSLSEE